VSPPDSTFGRQSWSSAFNRQTCAPLRFIERNKSVWREQKAIFVPMKILCCRGTTRAIIAQRRISARPGKNCGLFLRSCQVVSLWSWYEWLAIEVRLRLLCVRRRRADRLAEANVSVEHAGSIFKAEMMSWDLSELYRMAGMGVWRKGLLIWEWGRNWAGPLRRHQAGVRRGVAGGR
jgi:hypothetical protein